MNRIFIAGIIPKEIVYKYEAVSQAETNFCERFIKAIRPDKVFSIVPITISKKESFPKDAFGSDSTFVQVRLFKQKGKLRIVNSIIENLRVAYAVLKQYSTSNIWIYNIRKQNLLLVLIFLFLRKKLFFVIADFNIPTKKFSLNYLFLKVVGRSNGVISLSSNFSSICSNPNIRSLAGISDFDPSKFVEKDEISRKKVLYAGSFYLPFGIDLALEVFSKKPDFELIVTGHGADKITELVKDYSSRFNNIKYLGFLSFEEYQKVLSSVDICLSLRNPSYIENQYNFPSKVIEFLSHGKFVISTLRYPTVPDNVLFHCEYNLKSVMDCIDYISSLPTEQIANRSSLIKSFMSNTFSYDSWSNYVYEVENSSARLADVRGMDVKLQSK